MDDHSETEHEPVGERDDESVAASEPSSPAKRGRRVGAFLAAFALTLAVGGALMAAGVSWRHGEGWKQQAEEHQAANRRLAAALEEAQGKASELAARIDAISAEKAAAQDERNLAEGERDVYQRLVELAGKAAVDLSDCQQANHRAAQASFDALGRGRAGEDTTDWDALEALAERANSVCANAHTSFDAFADAVDAARKASDAP